MTDEVTQLLEVVSEILQHDGQLLTHKCIDSAKL